VPTQLLLDSVATRYDPAKLGRPGLKANLVITDRQEQVGLEAGSTVFLARVGRPLADPAVTVTGPRKLILGLLFLKLPAWQLAAAGLKIEGDAGALDALQGALDPLQGGFNIAEP
jgi:alkyl sulfatase BDS1-like metallo-beta-lactamase superfamily hydrolase